MNSIVLLLLLHTEFISECCERHIWGHKLPWRVIFHFFDKHAENVSGTIDNMDNTHNNAIKSEKEM